MPKRVRTVPDPDTTAESIQRLAQLAFADRDELKELLRFQEQELPALEKSPAARRMGALFRQFVTMALQGNSLHPSDPTQLAGAARAALMKPAQTPRALRALATLLVGPDGEPRSGHNALVPAHPAVIIAHEHQRRTGAFEVAYRTPVKYRDYQVQVDAAPEFHGDWQALKRQFKVERYRDRHGIIRRSPNPEYNWRRPTPLNLSDPAAAFHAAFDFFCWKWFLWGMRGDAPLVEQLFYAITPYGTQIFIPGYWSLDAARDVRWEEIKKLHAARGLKRQGEKSAANRQDRAHLIARLQQANREAKQSGLRGGGPLRLPEGTGPAVTRHGRRAGAAVAEIQLMIAMCQQVIAYLAETLNADPDPIADKEALRQWRAEHRGMAMVYLLSWQQNLGAWGTSSFSTNRLRKSSVFGQPLSGKYDRRVDYLMANQIWGFPSVWVFPAATKSAAEAAEKGVLHLLGRRTGCHCFFGNEVGRLDNREEVSRRLWTAFQEHESWLSLRETSRIGFRRYMDAIYFCPNEQHVGGRSFRYGDSLEPGYIRPRVTQEVLDGIENALEVQFPN